MNLQTYLDREKLTPYAFAKKIGVPPSTVYRYLAGRLPRQELVEAIYKATNGDVQPNDFYDLKGRTS